MNLPIGASLYLTMSICTGASTITCAALEEAWNRWLSRHRFLRKLQRLERRGYVHRTPGGRNIDRIVQLTRAGLLVAWGGRDPAEWWNRTWDGYWRAALWDIPELNRKDRIRLKNRLQAMHFGCLQKSVWITPDPVRDLAAALAGLDVDAGVLTLFEGRPAGFESDADLVRKAWDFGAIDCAYGNYLEVLDSPPRFGGHAAREEWLKIEWRAWAAAIGRDPLLPRALLPPGYRGLEAWHRRVAVLPAMIRG